MFVDGLGMNLVMVDASERFLSKLEGVSDPETKRKTIGAEFIKVFEEEAKKSARSIFWFRGPFIRTSSSPAAEKRQIGRYKNSSQRWRSA